jgi:hypothetical protein
MKASIIFMAAIVFLSGCKKMAESILDDALSGQDNQSEVFTIKKGNHYSGNNHFKMIDAAEMRFVVKFDSSAIYNSLLPENQNDINKLYGFSDNSSDHHQFSARFGWRWSNGALRLFAYVYNLGKVSSKEIGTIAIGKEINCSIMAAGNEYIFHMNDKSVEMPRLSATPQIKGYQLYPYFGGNEPAPHDITIRITPVR